MATHYNTAYTTMTRTIEVPLQQEQVLEVTCDDLPTDPKELTDIFRQESVTFEYYHLLAVEYYRQGMIEQSIAVIEACLTIASQSPHTQPRQKLPLLTLMATLYLRRAKMAPTTPERIARLDEVAKFVNEADRIHSQYEHTLLVKANLHLMRGDANEGLQAFETILAKRPDCVAALIGKAKVQYLRKQYKEALYTYQSALVYSQGKMTVGEIRYGIGQCYAQLGKNDLARAALNRCVRMNEPCSKLATILLAIIELNEAKDTQLDVAKREKSIQHGLKHMKDAYEQNDKHPVTLNMLASHFFMIDDLDKATAMALKASDNATNSVIKAESFYQIARAYHQKGSYDDAFNYYKQCIELNPDHRLAQFGIAQLHTKKGNLDAAVQLLEKLNTSSPKNIEILKMLGTLYWMTGKETEALSTFNEILKINEDISKSDPFFDIEMARLHEENDHATALKHYEKFYETINGSPSDENIRKTCAEIKAEVANNIGVMHHVIGNNDKAEEFYSIGIQEWERRVKEKHSEDSEPDLQLTMSYNLGRLYEQKCETDKAQAIYKRLTEEYPSYYEAFLRLGAIELESGHASEAIEHYKEVFDHEQKNPDAWIMIGQAEAPNNERMCRRAYEKVLKDCDRNDIYAHVALGNFHAANAREMKSEKSRQQRLESYKLAVSFFTQALKREPTNIYAANGLAIVMAENGHLDFARDLFQRVREATSTFPSIWVNLAHFLVETKHYADAVVMYNNALKKFYDEIDANLVLCLARAQYLLAKAEKSPKEMFEALKTTEKALNLSPGDKSILHNIALVQQSYCQLLLDKEPRERTSKQLREAIVLLESSQRTFRYLINVPANVFVLYDRKVTEQRERYGETLKTQLERKLRDQMEYEEESQTSSRKREREDDQEPISESSKIPRSE